MKHNKDSRIDKNSIGTVVLIFVISLIAINLSIIFVDTLWARWALVLFFALFAVWQTFFHMVPARKCPGSDTVVTSVSDGRVVIAEKIYESEYLKRECMMVSVYMDFWDVHANFWPVDGEVCYYRYYPGSHHLAFKPKASDENEHSCTGIRTEAGKEVFFKQIAGTFARRIVCYSRPGLKTSAGDQCGIIKFGSRVDMFLPLEAELKVKVGDVVRACETVIAEI